MSLITSKSKDYVHQKTLLKEWNGKPRVVIQKTNTGIKYKLFFKNRKEEKEKEGKYLIEKWAVDVNRKSKRPINIWKDARFLL